MRRAISRLSFQAKSRNLRSFTSLLMKFLLLTLLCVAISIFAFAQESTTPPPRVYPVALPNYDEETATRLQIFLDNSDFGPGKIDGRMGEFFRKALISYKHAHAMP